MNVFTVPPLLPPLIFAATIILTTLLVRWLLLRFVPPLLARHSHLWAGILEHRRVLQYLYLAVPGLTAAILVEFWPSLNPTVASAIHKVGLASGLVMITLAVVSGLYAYEDYYEQHFEFAKQVPIKTMIQVAVVAILLIALVLIISLMLGIPLVAMAGAVAVIAGVAYYLFREPLLGFTASLQLSMNHMLAIGDWIEMDSFGADGLVEDINVTSTKVRNWDNTLINVPTYALIQNSFQNWRGMQDRQSRLVKRALVVDQLTIVFVDPTQATVVLAEIKELYENLPAHVQAGQGFKGLTPRELAEHERLTNLELFMAYATCLIAHHPQTRTDQNMYVRQQAPSAHGLPVELYFFTSATDFIPFHAVQRDIFSALLAALPQFELRPYQVIQNRGDTQ